MLHGYWLLQTASVQVQIKVFYYVYIYIYVYMCDYNKSNTAFRPALYYQFAPVVPHCSVELLDDFGSIYRNRSALQHELSAKAVGTRFK